MDQGRTSHHLVLSACHPLLTAQALAADPQAGWLSPSTVVVRAVGTGTLVEAGDPSVLLPACDRAALPEIAGRIRRLLTDALDMLPTPDRVR